MERFVFGNYVQYHRSQATGIAQIDHVFVLENFEDRHIFAILTPIRFSGHRDPILDLRIMNEGSSDILIVGLPAIDPVRLYIVPVDNVRLVLVD